jgi:hypothetical protein
MEANPGRGDEFGRISEDGCFGNRAWHLKEPFAASARSTSGALAGSSGEVFSPAGEEAGEGVGHAFKQDAVFGAECILVIAFDAQYSYLARCQLD